MIVLLAALAAIGGLTLVVGRIMLLVAAFGRGAGWGLAVFFLPIADIVFCVKFWAEARRAFWIQAAGVALAAAVVIAGLVAGVGPMREAMLCLSAPRGPSPDVDREAAAMAPVERDSGPRTIKLPPHKAKTGLAAAPAPAAPPPPATEAAPAVRRRVDDPLQLRGWTLADVRRAMGPPKGEMMSGGQVCLLYEGYSLFSEDGRTVGTVQFDTHPLLMSAAIPGSGGAAARKGMEKPPARPAPEARRPAPKPAAPAPPPVPAAADAEDVKVIAAGGARVDLANLLAPGKVTMVDFYADWCGPCRALSPHLEKMARQDPDVVLRKVDIVNWDSEVCKQYDISSVPNVRVFDRGGKPVGAPTHDYNAIAEFVRQAK